MYRASARFAARRWSGLRTTQRAADAATDATVDGLGTREEVMCSIITSQC